MLYIFPKLFALLSIYIMGLVFEWIKSQGGLEKIESLNRLKSQSLYDTVDNSNGFYV